MTTNKQERISMIKQMVENYHEPLNDVDEFEAISSVDSTLEHEEVQVLENSLSRLKRMCSRRRQRSRCRADCLRLDANPRSIGRRSRSVFTR
jgi:hypothetical protein